MSYNFRTPAFSTKGISQFHSKRTVLFKAERGVDIDAAKILAARVCFTEPPGTAKNRSIKMSSWMPGREYLDLDRADLIVTDEPLDIYGYIDQAWYMSKLKLPAVVARAREVLQSVHQNTNLDTFTENWGWPQIHNLTPADRARVLAESITHYCMSQRKSEAELLGYVRLSWDEFAAKYTTVIQNTSNGLTFVHAFPSTKRDTLVLNGAWKDTDGVLHTNEQAGAIIFGEHRQEGELTAWIVDTKNPKDFFDPRKRAANLFRADDYEAQERAIELITATAYVLAKVPVLSFGNAPSVLRQVSFTHEFPKRTFSAEDFTELARRMKVRGYSLLTKAELTIKMGEVMATQPPTDMQPALIFPNRHSITDINFDDADEVERRGKNATLEDYMAFYGRLVSGRAYVPGSEPSPAGRIPTDGSFEDFVGVSPLDIINDVA